MVFNKRIQKGNQTFHFSLVVREEVIDDSAYNIVDKVFSMNSFPLDLERTVRYIRKIFNEYHVKSLLVEVGNYKEGNYESVILEQGKVFEYTLRKPLTDGEVQTIATIQFAKRSGFAFSVEPTKNLVDILSSKNELMNQLISESIQKLQCFVQPSSFSFNNAEEANLVDYYENFFGKSPDFSIKKCVSCAQSMTYLLSLFEYNLSKGESYEILNEGHVSSSHVQSIMDSLAPFGKVSYNDGMKKVFGNNKVAGIVSIINEFIKDFEDKDVLSGNSHPMRYQNILFESLHISEDKVSLLATISTVCYLKILWESSCESEDELVNRIIGSGFVNCSREEVRKICTFISDLSLSIQQKEEMPLDYYRNLVRDRKSARRKNLINDF